MITEGLLVAGFTLIGGIVTAPFTYRAGEKKEANRNAERMRELDLETTKVHQEDRKAAVEEDLLVSAFVRDFFEARLAEEKKLTEEIRTELHHTRAQLREANESVQQSRAAVEAALLEAHGCRVDNERMRGEIATLSAQMETQRVRQEDMEKTRRQLEIALLENERLRTNLNAMRLLWEQHLAKEKIAGGAVPLDGSMWLGLDEEYGATDSDPEPGTVADSIAQHKTGIANAAANYEAAHKASLNPNPKA